MNFPTRSIASCRVFVTAVKLDDAEASGQRTVLGPDFTNGRNLFRADRWLAPAFVKAHPLHAGHALPLSSGVPVQGSAPFHPHPRK